MQHLSAEQEKNARRIGASCDELNSLGDRIRYLAEAVEEASDHVQPIDPAQLDYMNKMLVFTSMIRETATQIAFLASRSARDAFYIHADQGGENA